MERNVGGSVKIQKYGNHQITHSSQGVIPVANHALDQLLLTVAYV
jgi:hypothetical protein